MVLNLSTRQIGHEKVTWVYAQFTNNKSAQLDVRQLIKRSGCERNSTVYNEFCVYPQFCFSNLKVLSVMGSGTFNYLGI